MRVMDSTIMLWLVVQSPHSLPGARGDGQHYYAMVRGSKSTFSTRCER